MYSSSSHSCSSTNISLHPKFYVNNVTHIFKVCTSHCFFLHRIKCALFLLMSRVSHSFLCMPTGACVCVCVCVCVCMCACVCVCALLVGGHSCPFMASVVIVACLLTDQQPRREQPSLCAAQNVWGVSGGHRTCSVMECVVCNLSLMAPPPPLGSSVTHCSGYQ